VGKGLEEEGTACSHVTSQLRWDPFTQPPPHTFTEHLLCVGSCELGGPRPCRAGLVSARCLMIRTV
jgi:hypothetical protein